MNRRQLLASGAALGLLPATAFANPETYQRFHAALERDPTLAVYADMVGERSGDAAITGRMPADLEGVFFRNGPGRFELGGERYHHWFDGDGYAQRWQIAHGKVSHRGKFVATQKFTDESQAGQFLYPAFGTQLSRRGIKSNDTMNAANTNLLPFGGRLYALWEGGSAIELNPVTLDTVGIKTWRDDQKAMPFSAHPKIDQDGSMWNFGALPFGGRMALYHIGADGALLQASVVEVPQLAMVHDFVISAQHLIFLVPPFDLSPDTALSFADRHAWAGTRPMRAVVVSKATLQVRQVFELDPHMVFHFGNAFDDGQTTRLDAVLHDGNAIATLGALMRGERQSNLERSHTAQITLDYASGKAHQARLFGNSEFPRVMPQVAARRHRKLAVLSSAARNREYVFDTVNLIDTDTGKADSYRFDAGWQAEEHVLVPRRHARSETDGYLVGVAQDTRRGETVMTVFDAAHVGAGPLALARLGYRTPVCFHGNFLPA
ncbi:carotenoid oxygenase family protein [Massilia sp. R2A-15]|uniref:carotenoid oxygenase family protein n=1 Tax=Massilia sp. R2A-15 TaxID=3064278 RepID=UPI002734B268|nr:carotenoid oxygenase family protein [Massilia sp. R2A-15]WLI91476.1 carotenoid oxygenase family protein [Massilia sp. R2A-15]